MKFIIESVKDKLKLNEEYKKVLQEFNLVTTHKEERIETDEADRFYELNTIEVSLIDLIKIENILNADLILTKDYCTPEYDLIKDVNVLKIYDDYLD